MGNIALRNLALLFGYGQDRKGELLPQMKARCDTAIEAYHQGEIDKIYLTCFVHAGAVMMHDKVKDYLTENDVFEVDIILHPEGTNTAGEIDAFLSIVNPKENNIFAISSSYHIPRILFLFWTRKVSAKPLSTWKETGWRDVRIEPVKMLNSFLRPFSWSKRVKKEE